MTIPSNLKRLLDLPKIGILAAVLGLSIFWACHIDPNSAHEELKITGDTAWTKCDTVFVVLLDKSDKVLDTIFNDPLHSLDELANLPADKYPGGTAKVHIFGKKNGASCFDQTRTFDDTGSKVVIDTLSAPDAKILSVDVLPTSLLLSVADSAVSVTASIKPAYADQAFIWSVEDDKIASLQFPNGPNAGRIKIKGLAAGIVKARVRSKNDTSKYAEVTLNVVTGAVSLVTVSPDTLHLYMGGPGDSLTAKVLPAGTDQGVDWTSDNLNVAEVDVKGLVTPKGEGSAHIQARSKVLGSHGSAVVLVKRDLPTLTVDSRSGAATNVPIEFSARAVQEFGTITLFKMDYDGNGKWDDSLTGPWSGNIVDLPVVSHSYPVLGDFVAKFLVRDGEGNEAIALVSLSIGNQAPQILNISKDTTISIKDSLKLFAKVKDFEGKVAWSGWDFEGDGIFDDSITTADSVVDIIFGHKYLAVGIFNAVLKVKDDVGKTRLDTVKVHVILDPPVADAGNDTTVMAGTFVEVHAKGTDKYGSLTKREIQIGSGAFLVLSKQDTLIRPPVETGKFNLIVRVTDDDGNSALDTMVVTVSTPILSNNSLASLIPSVGSLTPSFKAVTLLYSVVVAFTDSQLTIKATPADSGAKMAINGKPTAAGVSSDPVSVLVGTTVNVFQIVVTAQDGTQLTYGVSVTRAPNAEAQLSKLEVPWFVFKPAFNSETLDYTDTVGNDVSSLTLKATASAVGAKVAINDINYPSGTNSSPLALIVGSNKIYIKVTAQDGKTTATYSLSVVRRAKLLVFRKLGLALPVETFTLEAPLGSLVNISAPDTLGFTFSKWTFSNGTGVFTDSTAKSTKVTITSPTVSVTAKFDTTTYIISSSVGTGGTITPASKIVNHGMNFIATVTPNFGYRVLTFTDNGKPSLDPAKVSGFIDTIKSVTESHILAATFVRIYTLTATSTNPTMGTIVPGPKPIVVDSGTNQTFSLQSLVKGQYAKILSDNTADVVASLQGDPLGASTYTLLDIKANHIISTTFAIKTFTISTKGQDKLRGTVTPELPSVNYGGNAIVFIQPAKGYRVLTVTDNDVDVFKIAQDQNFNYVINSVTENHVIIATFLRTYTLTGITNNEKLGVVSPAALIVDSLTSQDFTMSAAAGQYITAFTDNTKNVIDNLVNNVPGDKSTYTLKEITEDHTVSATFAQKTYTLTVNGTDVCIKYICPPGQFCLIQSCPVAATQATRVINYGNTLQWTIATAASSATGLPFSGWTGSVGASGNPATIGPVTSDLTYSASYGFIILPRCPPICGPGVDPIIK